MQQDKERSNISSAYKIIFNRICFDNEKVFYPDLMPTYQDYKRYDVEALKRIILVLLV